MDFASLFGLLAVFVLIAINGFFVAAEFALVKVRATRIEQLVNEGKKSARVAQQQIEHLDTSIAATQLGITLASLALGWIGEPSLAHLVEPLFAWAGGAAAALSHTLAIAISFFLITSGHIILGELVPKALALQRPEATALLVARPLRVFARLLHPFILLMNGTGNLILRWLGMHDRGEHGAVHSPKELEMLVIQSRKAGLLQAQEEELLRHVFDFEETEVRQVMVPRPEIVALPVTSTFEQVRQVLTAERYTRYPVYEKTIDTVIGMLHLKDLADYSTALKDPASFDLRQLLRPVLDVPELSSIGDLLTRMQRERVHLAVVIDEYGATAGIVTMEDIVEELVGEVQDEFDILQEGVRPEIEVLPDGSSSVDGLLALTDFAERFNVQITSAHAQTLG
ncbi:MAG: hemolysin family protein, partial [Ktedonobacteraceae bacterium]